MNRGQFVRRMIYLGLIVALLAPISMLSMPSRRGAGGEEVGGGVLSRMRDEAGLSQANLGEIDPTGEAIKLATMGMRGIAADVLWLKFLEQQKKEDWIGSDATLKQITKLQPNFTEVWRHQAWNVSYNISVQFDDYRDRYYWVIHGIDFLKEGTRYNEDSPKLLVALGWTIGQKIGRADEHKEFRELFRQDDDFHGARPAGERDNWLVGREWMLEAQNAAERRNTTGGASPLVFYSHAPLFRIDYAEALEEEGTFGEVARDAWQTAAADWTAYGEREIPTSLGKTIRLGDVEAVRGQIQALTARLDELAPGAREAVVAEKRAALSDEQRTALETPVAERTEEQYSLASQADQATQVTHEEIAKRAADANRAEALDVAKQLVDKDEDLRILEAQRQTVNFAHWSERTKMESDPVTVDARRLIYEADQAYRDADLAKAPELYQQGFQRWREALDKYPGVLADGAFVSDMAEPIKRYRDMLSRRDEPFPEDFILKDVMIASDPTLGQ